MRHNRQSISTLMKITRFVKEEQLGVHWS